jgi:hypothetical protein
MKNGTRKFALAGALCIAIILAGCNAEGPTATNETGGDAAVPSLSVSDSSGVNGQEATTAGDTTGRGGVYVGSGH